MTPQEPAAKMPTAGGIPPEVLALAQMTLDEFEGTTWGDPPEDATYVQHTCYELRRTPLGQFEAEDLRIMIGQQIGLELLVPRALGALIQQPLIEADMYPGDLLRAVLALPDSFWHSHPAEDQRLRVAVAAFDAIDPNDPENPLLFADFAAALASTRRRWAR